MADKPTKHDRSGGSRAIPKDIKEIERDCIIDLFEKPIVIFLVIIFLFFVILACLAKVDSGKTRVFFFLFALFLPALYGLYYLTSILRIKSLFKRDKINIISATITEKRRKEESDGTGEGTYYTYMLYISGSGTCYTTSRRIYKKVETKKKYHLVVYEKNNKGSVLQAYDHNKYKIVLPEP